MNRLTTILTTVIALASSSLPVTAEQITLTGYDAFQARQKTICGTTEQGKTRYGIFQGTTYSRVPGEKDRALFSVLGINIRHCLVVQDEVRGKGFRSVSREIMVYMDPETKEVIDTWTNPWNGNEVEVLHVANDPVNMRAIMYERDEKGEPSKPWVAEQHGDVIASSAEIPLFYKNPLGGENQKYVGGTYHAMEIFNMFYDSKNLLDTNIASVGQSNLGWSRIAKWLPWMEMGDFSGLMVFNANGFSTFDKSRVPEKLMTILKNDYPLYMTPPPLDDDRPNETSWTVFEKHIAKKRAEAEKAKAE